MDPTLAELDFTGGLTDAEIANLATLDAWEKHEAAATAVLNERADGPDSLSLISKAVLMAADIPAGHERTSTVFCRATMIGGEAALAAGIRISSRDRPQETPAYVVLALVAGDEYQTVDEDVISEADAVKIGSLVIGKIRWAQLRGVQLSADCADIILPTPELPAV